jgi:hypothetical protein
LAYVNFIYPLVLLLTDLQIVPRAC